VVNGYRSYPANLGLSIISVLIVTEFQPGSAGTAMAKFINADARPSAH
jgi:hypothetical protein